MSIHVWSSTDVVTSADINGNFADYSAHKALDTDPHSSNLKQTGYVSTPELTSPTGTVVMGKTLDSTTGLIVANITGPTGPPASTGSPQGTMVWNSSDNYLYVMGTGTWMKILLS
jgi:hypothetical protein